MTGKLWRHPVRQFTWLLAGLLSAGLVGPAAARAAKKTCLTGTDPSVTADAAQIAAVRAAIDTACPCTTFDGSAGKTHGSYVSCANGVMNSLAASGDLRSQCKGTVKKYYSVSTCGVPASKGMVPCVKKTAKGAVSCAAKAASTCVDKPGKYTQAACSGFNLCVDAADTDGDGIIGATDSGACSTCTGRFCDRGNGTITDKQTGLMWEKKDRAGSLHDAEGRYTWAGKCSDDSLCQPNAAAASACSAATGGALGCSQCSTGSCNVDPISGGASTTIWDWLVQLNASSFADHSNWRIPTVSQEGDTAELETILSPPFPDCLLSPCVPAEFNTGCIDGCSVESCSCTGIFPNSIYWSATTSTSFPDAAWVVLFGNGVQITPGKDSTLFVRAVR